MILVSLALAAGLVAPHAFAADLMDFAKSYADKFPSEVADKSVFDQQYVVRASLDRPASMEYDDAAGVATLTMDSARGNLAYVNLPSTCASTGKAAGTTGLGIQVEFERRTCQDISLVGIGNVVMGTPFHPSTYTVNSRFTIPLTPAEFRKLKDAGHVDVAITLKAKVPARGPIVELKKVVESPTTERPIETTSSIYRVAGTVSQLQFFLPWSDAPFFTQAVASQ